MALPYEIDLDEVARSVGKTSYARGATYARRNRVLSLVWDEEQLVLTGKVLGTGLYTTELTFAGAGTDIEFDYGECSCPIGFDCKHVAAVAVAAAGKAVPARSGSAARAATGRTPRVAREQAASPSWQERLGPMLGGPAAAAVGSPLALELSIAASTYTREKRLQAKLMRPGARGGWVNGSLSWNRLDPWDRRDAQIREDHLEVARGLRSLAEASRGSRYLYSYRVGSLCRDLLGFLSRESIS